MAEVAIYERPVERPGDQTAMLKGQQARWIAEVQRYERSFQAWRVRSAKIVKLYKRQESDTDRAARRFAMLWANTEIMKPAVYAQVPVPVVSRRFKQKDPLARLAAEILERAIMGEAERSKIDLTLKRNRDDLLLPGRGTMWVRADDENGVFRVVYDYVHWRDFLHDPQRTWAEVTWVGRRLYMTRRQLAERFFEGNEVLAAKVPLDHTTDLSDGESVTNRPAGTQPEPRATVYEIWDRTSRQVIFVAKAGQLPLEIAEPYVQLEGFWPSPMPLFATITSDDLVPTPDYVYYQDQAEEIDQLTARIAKVSDSLKMVGFYSAGHGDATSALEKALQPGVENQMIPVESWAAFGEGGKPGGITWMPIEQVAACLREMIALRQRLIEDVFQTSGIADIMRGDSSPEETLGAQQIKSQWGSIRMRDKQASFQKYAAEVFKITAEIIAETFPPEQILAMANLDADEAPPEAAMQAVQLLQDQRLRGFKIDVETDSTIYPDEQAEKQARNEFLTAVGQFMQSAVPVAQAMPTLVPLLGEMLNFTVRGYRAGRDMEEQVEMAMRQLTEQLQAQAQNPKPDPAQAQLEADAKVKEGELLIKKQEAEAKIQLELKKHQDQMMLERERMQVEQAMREKQHELAEKQHQVQAESASFDQAMREDEYLTAQFAGDEESEAGETEDDMRPAQNKVPVTRAINSMLEQVAQLQQQNAQMQQQQMQALAENQQLMMQSLQMIAKALTAPKRAVYDPSGRIVGAETVTDQMEGQ